ncbi:fructose-2,6-bisphosphatase TIGAR B isoform X1 [Dunckerocampus dactyliophorus]|uniref:fructose-2,6-bisphosphatase TIGAR B isoform X1 n=1 Tax=Dunckerocampus dactyliophorus TaxID=161453 RepID=UPI002405E028|nr:fructose-2,6-bisphosphatase TIGAR B isoform X1 [Dunckerocampus dactyliophorus]
MFTFSLTFIRHGETQYNKDKLLQGQGVDTPLSDTGVRQAEAVGRYLADVPLSEAYASNLQRAVQTAELILANNTCSSGVELLLEPLLAERGFGVAEGRPKEELKNMANAAGQSCRDFTPPGGETLEQVKLRFQKFLTLIFAKMQEVQGWGSPTAASDDAPSGPAEEGMRGSSAHVLVVSHGAYIRVAVRHLVEDLKCSLPAASKMSQLLSPCPNTGISRFVLTLAASSSGPVLHDARCIFANRKDHLETLATDV